MKRNLSRKLTEFAEDLHETLGALAFMEVENFDESMSEINKYFFEKYGLSATASTKTKTLSTNLIFNGEDKQFYQQILKGGYLLKITNSFEKMIFLSQEELQEEAEYLFNEVNDYLNPLLD